MNSAWYNLTISDLSDKTNLINFHTKDHSAMGFCVVKHRTWMTLKWTPNH